MEEYIQEILENLLKSLDFSFSHIQIDLKKDLDGNDDYYCNVETKSSDTARLIGRGGKNIHAIQHLVKLILFKRTDQNCNITVDIDGYRERQTESVMGIAERHIAKARETKKPQALPPMSPYFRRLIHLKISENPEYSDLSTTSQGYGEHRHIIIQPKNEE